MLASESGLGSTSQGPRYVIEELCFCALRAALPFRNSREGSWPKGFAGLWRAVSKGSGLRSRDGRSFSNCCVPEAQTVKDRWRWAFETRAVLGLAQAYFRLWRLRRISKGQS